MSDFDAADFDAASFAVDETPAPPPEVPGEVGSPPPPPRTPIPPYVAPPLTFNAPPFHVEILDRTYKRVGFVGAPLSITLTARHNEISTCELTLPNDAPQAALLLAEGARLRVTYSGQTWTGPVRRVSGSGPIAAGTLTFGMDDDFRLLGRILAWPIPTAALDAQTREFDRRRGPAETVAKGFLGDNARRLGLPLTVEADQGRGSTVVLEARMQPLADVLLPRIDRAGIGLRVLQTGAGYVLSAYSPRAYPRTLTEQSGIVTAWELSREAPTATRVVVGGGLGDDERYDKEPQDFRLDVDSARETAWNDLAEVYVDAGDAASDYLAAKEDRKRAKQDLKDREQDVEDADKDWRLAKVEASGVADALTRLNEAKAARDTAVDTLNAAIATRAATKEQYAVELAERARLALLDGAPRAGVRVTLAETEHFSYGGPNGLLVGDRVRIEVGPGVFVDEVLREAVISWTADGGLLVTPAVGETDSPVRALVRGVGQIGAAVRALKSRR